MISPMSNTSLGVSLVLLVITGVSAGEHIPEIEPPASARLRTLLEELPTNPAAVQHFWKSCAGQCPLVEATDDPKTFLITFLWRADSDVERIEVHGGPFEHSRKPFQRLADTDVWYHSELLPSDSRYVYGLIVASHVVRAAPDGTPRRELVETYPLDPLNPNFFNEGPFLELPDAPSPSWHLRRSDVPQGELRVTDIKSVVLDESRRLRLYVPAGFRADRHHCLAVFLDGEDYDRLMAIPTVLDNLILSGKIPPTVALLVDSQTSRGKDLVFSNDFVKFLAEEAVPWAKSQVTLDVSPQQTVIGGSSLGGLTAAYAAHLRPQVFGNVLSQSGAYWRTHPSQSTPDEPWFPLQAARGTPGSVRYYLEVGRFESPSMIATNGQIRDVLKCNGNQVTYCEYNGGHDHFNWRTTVADGLIDLLGRDRPAQSR